MSQMTVAQVRRFARSNKKEVKRFVKFALVGAAGSITDFTVLNVLVFVVGWPPIVSNTCSVIAAILQNFMLNRRWSFPESRERHASGQIVRFALVSAVGLGINQIVFGTLSHLLQPDLVMVIGEYLRIPTSPDLAKFLALNLAKLFAIGVVLFWNFTLNRLWTYRGL